MEAENTSGGGGDEAELTTALGLTLRKNRLGTRIHGRFNRNRAEAKSESTSGAASTSTTSGRDRSALNIVE